MLPVNLVALIGLMAWGASASSASAESAPSPSADVELICHTDNPAECYPKVFQATDEFQIVRPDQDLPIGLHVRLNVYTGVKEAKINVPDEVDPSLEGLPVDSSVVIVERDEAEEQIKPPPNAPAYEPVGNIKKPKSADLAEGNAFYKSLTILKKGLDVDGALEMLEDISHDIYYGLKIAEDYETVHELFCLSTSALSSTSENVDSTILRRARLAALTLSSTVQNNPTALASIEAHWPKLAPSLCGDDKTRTTPLSSSIFTLLPTISSQLPTSPLTKARISLLTGLLKSPLFRAAFLTTNTNTNDNGASHILRILTTYPATQQQEQQQEDEDWAQTQRRAALLLIDTFLDADMGAAVGEWPLPAARGGTAQLSDGECEALFGGDNSPTSPTRKWQGREDECVDWLVRWLSERFRKDKGHWSHELWRGIKGRDRGAGEKVDL
jgi:nucleotide exchange factor SIL1